MNAPAPDAEVHIASFVVQHRETAADALAAMIREHADLDLALASGTRSVVICESADRHAVMARVDQLQAVPGVLNVLLVYHHAEPAHALVKQAAQLARIVGESVACVHTHACTYNECAYYLQALAGPPCRTALAGAA